MRHLEETNKQRPREVGNKKDRKGIYSSNTSPEKTAVTNVKEVHSKEKEGDESSTRTRTRGHQNSLRRTAALGGAAGYQVSAAFEGF